MDLRQLRDIKQQFTADYRQKVEATGYFLGLGLPYIRYVDPAAPASEQGKHCICARLQPLPGSPDPIDQGLLGKIRDEILPKEYKGVPVYVQYIGPIEAQ
jgi:hypothetical protein